MSYLAVEMVMHINQHLPEDKKLNSGEFSCMLVIANFADVNGRNAYPGIDTICSMLAMTKRQVLRVLASLEKEKGLLLVSSSRGKNKKTVYSLNIPLSIISEHRAKHQKRRQLASKDAKVVKSHLDQFVNEEKTLLLYPGVADNTLNISAESALVNEAPF